MAASLQTCAVLPLHHHHLSAPVCQPRVHLRGRSSSRQEGQLKVQLLSSQAPRSQLGRRGAHVTPRGAAGGSEPPKPSDESQENATVKSVESAFARSFGKPVWFAALALGVGVFGGFYAYYIVTFADIPILNGPRNAASLETRAK